MSESEPRPRVKTVVRIVWKLAILVLALVAATYAGNWVLGELNAHLTPSTEPVIHRLIMIAIAIYALLMMLPFVPGAEIGLAMMAMLGSSIVPLVYGTTVASLSVAFLVGRLVPDKAIIEIFETVRLKRAAHLLRQLEPLGTEERVAYLLQNASRRVLPFLLRHRYIALLAVLNVPGNMVIGGGGGICLVAGFSRLFVFPWFVLAIAIAVLPIPLIVFVTGQLPNW